MDRTYVFNSDGNGSGGSKLDITALLPGMFGGKGLDSNLAAALLSQNRNGFGGQDGWWSIIWLVVIASIFGWNGNGFGGFGGRGGNAIPAELAGNAGRELLMQAIQGNASAIGQIASSLNCSTQQVQTALCNIQGAISQVGNQVGLTGTQIINALQSGDNNIITQLSSCCCNVLQAIERQGAATQLQNCQNLNTLTGTMNANALSLRDGATANTNAILAKLDAMQNQSFARRGGRYQVQAPQHGKRALSATESVQSGSGTGGRSGCCRGKLWIRLLQQRRFLGIKGKEADMWDFFPNLLFRYPTLGRNNYNTIPSTGITVGTENVTIELPNHAFYRRNYVGSFFLDLREAIPAGTAATLPILIGTNGDTRQLMEYGTTPATVANFAGPGIYEIHYNRYTDQLYVVNGGFRPSAATATTASAESRNTPAY